jgi:group I intron endonuclease
MEETNDKKWCVYMHTNKTNNKVYVGITSRRPEKRWDYGCGYRGQRYFYRAIQKYGWDNFEHIIFAENLTQDEACKMEICLIALYQTNNSKYGYNLSAGGDGGTTGISWSDERRRHMSEKMKGRKISEETKRKISESHKGMRISEETRKKLSEQRIGESNSFYGKTHTQESKNRMSESHKGRPVTEEQLKCLELGRGTKYWTQETYDKLSKANRGEKSSTAKLTEEDVIDILKMIQQHMPYSEIKNKYAIADSEISRIKHGKRWGYLYEKYPELYG